MNLSDSENLFDDPPLARNWIQFLLATAIRFFSHCCAFFKALKFHVSLVSLLTINSD